MPLKSILKESLNVNRIEKLCLLGTFLSFDIILISILQVNASEWTMGSYGLVSILPVTFFVGLFLFCVSYLLLIRYARSEKILLLSTVLLIIILFGTPALIEGAPRFGWVYRVGGVMDYVARTGYTSTDWNSIGLLSMYQNWPGVFYLAGAIQQLSALSIVNILLYAPVVSQALYLLPLYMIFLALFNRKISIFLSCAMFFALNYVNQDFLSSQNLGLFLFLMVMGILLKLLTTKTRNNEYLLLLIIIFFTLVITHGLSSIGAYLLIALFLLFMNVKNRLFEGKRFNRLTIITFIMLTIVIGIWSLDGPPNSGMFAEGLSRLKSTNILDVFLHFEQAQSLGTTTAMDQTTILLLNLKILVPAIFLLIGISGFVYYLASIKFDLKRINLSSILSGTILLANGILYITPLYTDEAIIRAFLFSIVSVTFFAMQLIDNKKLACLLIISIFLFIPAHFLLQYGKENTDYYSPASINGAAFIAHHADTDPKDLRQTTILGLITIDALYNYENFNHSEISLNISEYGLYDFENMKNINEKTIVFISSSIKNHYNATLTNDYLLRLSGGYNNIYSASDVRLYTFS